ncbi:MAG TPA: type II CAAX endopeptidase family protein [Chloroflexia bacterium]|nr:type II CAAX endopeptidase family protein [Chloroflexia bacterium]
MFPRSGRLPAVVWSGLLAFGLTVVAGGIWTVLLVANLTTSPALPWAPGVMALLLWGMWQYLGGHGGPPGTAAARRRYLRATPVSRPVFAWAVLAGGLAIVALAGYWIVLVQLVPIPGHVLPDYSRYPLLTVVLVLGMSALVSALAEEAGFRGYFQGVLERTGRGPAAIVLAALLIAPAHALTQGFGWPTMLWYFAVDVMFGVLAYLTQSILPGSVVHILGLLTFFTLVWPADPQRGRVWETGADSWFWLYAAQALLGTVLALLAFRRLAWVTQRERGGGGPGALPP